MRAVALILLAALAGCKSAPILPPKVVEVVVEKIVPVPPQLTEPCQQPAKQGQTVQEAVRLANARKAALDECSGRMLKIRSLTP